MLDRSFGRARKTKQATETRTGGVDEVIIQARAADATILNEPQPADFRCYHAYFADPDGHRGDVVHNRDCCGRRTVMIGSVDD